MDIASNALRHVRVRPRDESSGEVSEVLEMFLRAAASNPEKVRVLADKLDEGLNQLIASVLGG